MSVLNRLEELRLQKGLNKSQFEKVLGKSTGYINTLSKQNSLPGIDVLMKILDNYPEVNLNWLMTGEGEMLKPEVKPYPEDATGGHKAEEPALTLEEFRAELREDMKTLSDGLTANFAAIHESLFILLKGNTRSMDLLDKMDEEKIRKTAAILNEYLEEHKDK